MYRSGKQFMKDPATTACRIYIGNILDQVTTVDLEDRFKCYGNILGLVLQRGFGFIQFETEAEAQLALKSEHGALFFGRKLNVRQALDKGKLNPMNKNQAPHQGGPPHHGGPSLLGAPPHLGGQSLLGAPPQLGGAPHHTGPPPRNFNEPRPQPQQPQQPPKQDLWEDPKKDSPPPPPPTAQSTPQLKPKALMDMVIAPPKDKQPSDKMEVTNDEDVENDKAEEENEPEQPPPSRVSDVGSDTSERKRSLSGNRRGGGVNRGRQDYDRFSNEDFMMRDGPGRDMDKRDIPLKDGPPRDGLSRDIPLRDMSLRDKPLRDIPSRDMLLRDGTRRDLPLRDMPPRDMPIRDMPPRDMPIRDMPPRDMPIRDMPPRDMSIRDMPPRDMPPRDMPPRDMPPRDAPSRDPMMFYAREDSFRPPPPNYIPPPIERPERNDCEIIVVSRLLTEYAEYVEQRLKSIGLMVDLLFPNEDVPIGKVLANISSRGCLYAILVMPQNEEYRSLTLSVLHGIPQEHRNIPTDDAITLISRNFDAYMRGEKTTSPGAGTLFDRHPESIQMIFNLLAENRQLTSAQYERILKYLQDRKELQRQFESTEEEGDNDIEVQPNSKQAELQSRIMNILNKSTEDAPKPVEPPRVSSGPTPLLNDPSVQKALDSLLSGDMLKSIASGM